MAKKTKIQSGLSVEKVRKIVVRVKKMERLSEHTISNYNKLFHNLESLMFFFEPTCEVRPFFLRMLALPAQV